MGGLETALVELVFLGDPGGNAGESSMWGVLYIGVNNNKALVKITTVLARGAKVPHQHSDWGPGNLTLGEVLDGQVMPLLQSILVFTER